MKSRVLRSPMLVRKLRELAERRVAVEEGMGLFEGEIGTGRCAARRSEVERQLGEVTERIVDGMICKFESKGFIRVGFFSLSMVPEVWCGGWRRSGVDHWLPRHSCM